MSDISHFSPAAPDELWRVIFRFATVNPESSRLYDIEFAPFRESWMDSVRSDTTLDTKRAIVLVCRHWRALGTEFFYEHMEVSSLHRLLQARGHYDDDLRVFGRFIRRLVLPSRPLQGVRVDLVRLIDILKRCPRVEILVQPAWSGGHKETIAFWDGISSPTSIEITQIKRIDWCTIGNEDRYDTHCARLSALLRTTPNLRYLSLHYDLDPFPGPSYLIIPSLTTLRLRGDMGVYGLGLPNLKNIILNNIGVVADRCIFSRIGPNLQVLQLGGYGNGYQFDIFTLSPNLREFCCTVSRETIVVMGCLHPLVHTVRLYCRSYLDGPAIVGFQKKSALLYNKTAFPALKQVVLHGEWSKFIKHPDFRLFRLRLFDRGCAIEYEDGTPLL